MKRFGTILMMLVFWVCLMGCGSSHDHTTVGWHVAHELHDLDSCEPAAEKNDVASGSTRIDWVAREGVRQVLNRGYLLAR